MIPYVKHNRTGGKILSVESVFSWFTKARYLDIDFDTWEYLSVLDCFVLCFYLIIIPEDFYGLHHSNAKDWLTNDAGIQQPCGIDGSLSYMSKNLNCLRHLWTKKW